MTKFGMEKVQSSMKMVKSTKENLNIVRNKIKAYLHSPMELLKTVMIQEMN